MGNAQQMKGWFTLPGRPGDRTLEQQMMGLDWLFANCRNKSVLDAGCAEGLISLELVKAGAEFVHGVEVRAPAVSDATRLAYQQKLNAHCTFQFRDLNLWEPNRSYDIVIGLAILHKLKNPSAAARMLAQAAKEAVVFRLPPRYAPTVVDERSGNIPHDIAEVMQHEGFKLAQATNDGPFGEWVGVWTR